MEFDTTTNKGTVFHHDDSCKGTVFHRHEALMTQSSRMNSMAARNAISKGVIVGSSQISPSYKTLAIVL